MPFRTMVKTCMPGWIIAGLLASGTLSRAIFSSKHIQNNVLQLEKSYPQPLPKAGEALIRVLQAGICNTDLEIIRGYMEFQGVLGHEFVGIVEEVLDKSGIPSAHSLVGQRVVGEINAA